MSKVQTIKGVLRTLLWMSKEELDEMDHKIFRIGFAVVGFVLMALFWLYFIGKIFPHPF